MRVAVIAITDGGLKTGLRIGASLAELGHQVDYYANHRGQNYSAYQVRSESLGELLGILFSEYDALCCVMALGIVIRLLGPLCHHKSQDPAVLVVDESGQFVISALSGHLGGANALARELARAIEATPVITTASDVQGKLAVDELSRQLGWRLEPLENLVAVNSALVNGIHLPVVIPEPIGCQLNMGTDYNLVTNTPWEAARFPQGAVVVSNRLVDMPKGPYILLRPKNICVGIGCRRGTASAQILEVLQEALAAQQLSIDSLKCVGTISAKADEEGLLAVAKGLGLPLHIYGAQEIDSYTQEYNLRNPAKPLSWSEFVYQKMGVGGVCEPVALMSGKNTKLIQGKVSNQGVTVALAEEL